MWPYTYPDILKKNDFVQKMQTIFKKKFVGEDSSQNQKPSSQILLDFNFGTIPTEFSSNVVKNTTAHSPAKNT